MRRPFKKQTFRDRVESRLDELTDQADDLRKQVVERAPGVRDQILEALPDKKQLLEIRDDLFEKLPDDVTDRMPDKVKPKRKKSRLKRVAFLGVLTGAGAAAFAALKRKGGSSHQTAPYSPTPAPTTPSPPSGAAAPASGASMSSATGTPKGETGGVGSAGKDGGATPGPAAKGSAPTAGDLAESVDDKP